MAGEVRVEELTGTGQSLVGFVEHCGEALEYVRDVWGDLEPDGDVGCGGAGGKSGGIVEEDFVRAGLDEERGQSGEVGEDRADELCPRVAGGGVVGGSPAQTVGVSAGSTAALVLMLSPDRVRSAHGDISTAARGCGSPFCSSATRVAAASPAPADSPAIAIVDSARLSASRPRYAATASSTATE